MAKADTLVAKDLSGELWREYEFGPAGTDMRTVYRIPNPVLLLYWPDGTTHRIVDSEGVVHLLPRQGLDGCVIRWRNKPGLPAAQF